MNYAIELNSDQSERILKGACGIQQPVQVQPRAWPDGDALRGHLQHYDGDTVAAQVQPTQPCDPDRLLNTYCHVLLSRDDGDYFFDCHVVAARQNGGGVELILARPQTIAVTQRRQSGRSFPARASAVQISRQTDGDLHCCEGRLYNLGEDGLACKLTKDHATPVALGQTWCLCFQIPDHDHVFKIDAAVRRILPSSSAQDVILGFEFDREHLDPTQHRELRNLLNQRQHAGEAAGAKA